MLAIITLVYGKISKVVPVSWIHNFNVNYMKSNVPYFSFWSNDCQKSPSFNKKLYSREFNGANDGVYKVFVHKVFDELTK